MILNAPDIADLESHGVVRIPKLLDAQQCRDLIAHWDDGTRFRKEVEMDRHGYGSGTYRYFDYPLPDIVARLRKTLYPALAPIANDWSVKLANGAHYPEEHAEFVEQCHKAGQTKATPLILRYREGGWNALHQDIYGENVFPLQLVILLSKPETDFTGGEFVLSEQRPRMQSRPEVMQLDQGDAVVFATRERPDRAVRGYRKVQLRHGVSRVRSGERWTLGIIFHDAA